MWGEAPPVDGNVMPLWLGEELGTLLSSLHRTTAVILKSNGGMGVMQNVRGLLFVLGKNSCSPSFLGKGRWGLHLVVIKVSIDGEPVPSYLLGFARCPGFGPPLDYTAGITLCPHELWDLLLFFLQGS